MQENSNNLEKANIHKEQTKKSDLNSNAAFGFFSRNNSFTF